MNVRLHLPSVFSFDKVHRQEQRDRLFCLTVPLAAVAAARQLVAPDATVDMALPLGINQLLSMYNSQIAVCS